MYASEWIYHIFIASTAELTDNLFIKIIGLIATVLFLASVLSELVFGEEIIPHGPQVIVGDILSPRTSSVVQGLIRFLVKWISGFVIVTVICPLMIIKAIFFMGVDFLFSWI